jgi:hypothetical protein
MSSLTLAFQDAALFAPRCSQAERDLNPSTPDECLDAIREEVPVMDQADSDASLRSTHASRLHGCAAT